MNKIIWSLRQNFSQWQAHLLLWFIKLFTLFIGFRSLEMLINAYTYKRETLSTFWEKTDFNYLIDMLMEMPSNIREYIVPVITIALAGWFLIDTFFDVKIISGISKKKIENWGQKFWRMFFVRLIFWIPYLVILAGAVYGTYKIWINYYCIWVFLLGGFVGGFVILFAIKWLDITKIMVVNDDDFKFGQIISVAANQTFSNVKETMLVNMIFGIFIAIITALTLIINIKFIATGSLTLWLLWFLRQLLVLSRQLMRYTYTGVWIDKS